MIVQTGKAGSTQACVLRNCPCEGSCDLTLQGSNTYGDCRGYVPFQCYDPPPGVQCADRGYGF